MTITLTRTELDHFAQYGWLRHHSDLLSGIRNANILGKRQAQICRDAPKWVKPKTLQKFRQAMARRIEVLS